MRITTCEPKVSHAQVQAEVGGKDTLPVIHSLYFEVQYLQKLKLSYVCGLWLFFRCRISFGRCSVTFCKQMLAQMKSLLSGERYYFDVFLVLP